VRRDFFTRPVYWRATDLCPRISALPKGRRLVPRMRTRIARIVALLLLAGVDVTTAQTGSIVGSWQGTSTCVDKVQFPACNDEQVIYDVSAQSPGADSVLIRADKIVNGSREFMGEFTFVRGAGNQWSTEFQGGRNPDRWELSVQGDTLTGRLLDLPSGSVVRRVSLRRRLGSD
jgi:hypothetical protein